MCPTRPIPVDLDALLDESGNEVIDLATDGVVGAEGAGLGGGLDQAEEARLGITDEEIERALRHRIGSRSD